jgi:hypothetical protein
MKEIVEYFWAHIARYFPTLISLTISPRTEVPSLLSRENEPLQAAMTFGALTFAFGVMMQAPLARGVADQPMLFAGAAAFKLIAVALFSATIFLAFRLVGGKGTFADTMSAYLYIVSPLYLVIVFFDVLVLGVLREYDEAAASDWLSKRQLPATYPIEMIQTDPHLSAIIGAAIAAILVATIGWLLYCWRIYRDIHQVTFWRSGIAYFLSFLTVVLLGYLFEIYQTAITDSEVLRVR